jgi:hypothetical protein
VDDRRRRYSRPLIDWKQEAVGQGRFDEAEALLG